MSIAWTPPVKQSFQLARVVYRPVCDFLREFADGLFAFEKAVHGYMTVSV